MTFMRPGSRVLANIAWLDKYPARSSPGIVARGRWRRACTGRPERPVSSMPPRFLLLDDLCKQLVPLGRDLTDSESVQHLRRPRRELRAQPVVIHKLPSAVSSAVKSSGGTST